jgi:RimJ/RimL family protein N-acetyltransferase
MTSTGPRTDKPPDRIVLPDLVLRRWSAQDAGALLEAVRESFGHLHAWMPWAAHEPALGDQQEFLSTAVRQWITGEMFAYGIFDPPEATLLGGMGLHDRVGPGGLEIGYWVHAAHTRRGVASTGAAMLTEVALSIGDTRRVEIHCDRANTASAAVPRRLGYRFDRAEEHAPEAPAECGERMIWIMTQDAYPGSGAARRVRTATATGGAGHPQSPP